MINEIKRVEKSYTYVKYVVRGENLTEEEINNVAEISQESTFGNDIYINKERCYATVTAYTD